MTHEAGKGSKQRPTNYETFAEGMERIFGKRVPKEQADEMNRMFDDAVAEEEEFQRIEKRNVSQP
jgi:hypothetical protein